MTPSTSGSGCGSSSETSGSGTFNTAVPCDLCRVWVPAAALVPWSPAMKPTIYLCPACARSRGEFLHRDPTALRHRDLPPAGAPGP